MTMESRPEFLLGDRQATMFHLVKVNIKHIESPKWLSPLELSAMRQTASGSANTAPVSAHVAVDHDPASAQQPDQGRVLDRGLILWLKARKAIPTTASSYLSCYCAPVLGDRECSLATRS